MLTLAEIDTTIDSLYSKQTDRLMKSGKSVDAFLAQPDEMAVTYEISEYEKMRDSLEKAAA